MTRNAPVSRTVRVPAGPVAEAHNGTRAGGVPSAAVGPGRPTAAGRGAPLPGIALPKGGGAIRGIGEKFAANPVTGTGSLSVPIAASPGRSGFGPQLSLSYDSGAGNGPFGFGWSLALPAISRKTDKGLPQYRDAEDSDVFLLSGAEDLVPLLASDGQGHPLPEVLPPRVVAGATYLIRRYRPRIEGLFARIERWTRESDGDVHWRSISKDNVLTLYGTDSGSRIADPAAPGRIFSWLIRETRDDKGNAVVYDYKPEDGTGADLGRAHERNRGSATDPARATNRYLKRIRYGNRVALLDQAGQRPPILAPAQLAGAAWMFELVFDYGEHDLAVPRPGDAGPWTYRPDPFSSYRSGFEVRTCRLCRRVLMFHHFPEEPGVGADCLVRSTDFAYSCDQDPADERNPSYSFLLSVAHAGYRRADGGYLKRSLPPVQFEYSRPVVQEAVVDVDPKSLENLPNGVDGAVYQWTDLHGEGIAGILCEQAGAWFYKRNISPRRHTPDGTPAEFAPLECVAETPNAALGDGQAQFMDLAGDGQPDLVVLAGPAPGLYEHDEAEGWQPFRPFSARLNRDPRDPNLRFVDLDGDGHADVLITEDEALVWHASLGEQGFGPAQRVPLAPDEERGPRLVFADGTQSIHLADLSGDGLTDFVRVRNGDVCYWPNLGYGRFGAKVAMDNAPWFDEPDQFDPRRILLADIDGSGTTDILYLHRDGVRLYFNQSGNSWSAPHTLAVCPRIDDIVDLAVTDLLGNGTACLVWSSPLPGDGGRPMRYVNLMGPQKPHLLVRTINNLGAETAIEYAPSTKFYLQDKHAGRPWLARLPFPVHVVERVITYDRVSGNRFVSRYAYHHGAFDGEEREFRGFGMVEQWDTEIIAELHPDGALPPATNGDPAAYVPPVLTKTWFHTGIQLGRDHISDYFAGTDDGPGEYYREPALRDAAHDADAAALLLADTVLPPELTPDEEREACRALKGSMLRQEVYALDGTDRQGHPYTVAEQNFTVVRLQPKGDNRHAVFLTHPREALTYHYERNPADPRVQHALTLEVDPYGNVLRQVTVGYGRRERIAVVDDTGAIRSAPNPAQAELQPADWAKQTKTLLTYTRNVFTHAVGGLAIHADHYRAPQPAEARTYELTGFAPENQAVRFSFEQWTRNAFAALDGAAEIPYEQTADGIHRRRRLIEHLRTHYRRDDLTALLPLGAIEPLALPGESYILALTPSLLAQVFRRKRPGQADESLLPDPTPLLVGTGPGQGGYFFSDGAFWIPSGRIFFDPAAASADPASTAAAERASACQHFFLPRKAVDPFGQASLVDYDGPADPAAPRYDLFPVRTCDALANTLVAAHDYRVLQPCLVTDPNGNRSAAAFDVLGMPVATALMGKAQEPDGQAKGDLLEAFDSDPPLASLQAFAADPRGQAPGLLGHASTRLVYDLGRYARTQAPPFVATLARETHFYDDGGAEPRTQIAIVYSDGFGREIQKKVQAEPGAAPRRQAPVPLPAGDVAPGEIVRDPQGGIVQAPVAQRWVGTGRTVFNNKGKPVKQYEPFFSATPLYEPERDLTDSGVSPVFFYDPVGRVVATLHPNHTYEKVVFDPWRHATWDGNDTVLDDPRTDPHIGGFVRAYFDAQPAGWQTWHAQRVGRPAGDPERDAADKAAAHARTEATAHLDTLGRPFLTWADNGPDPAQPEEHLRFATRVEIDIEGNQRAVRDAVAQAGDLLGRIVMTYDYGIAGPSADSSEEGGDGEAEDEEGKEKRRPPLHQASMEAGERWTLSDVTGQPIRSFDSRGHIVRHEYDPLRRPWRTFVTGAEPDQPDRELLVERLVYGEQHPQAAARNLRGRVHLHLDTAGLVANETHDFKGNLLHATRRVASDYRNTPDWAAVDAALPATAPFDPPAMAAAIGPLVEAEAYASRTGFDALNRPTRLTEPDQSVIRYGYNEASLLETVQVNLAGAAVATAFVDNIDYDAKGQRLRVVRGNDRTTTFYDYDPLTYRLVRLATVRGNRGAAAVDCAPALQPRTCEDPPAVCGQLAGHRCVLQDLHYTYDPAGNITRIRDDAQQTIFFRNRRVDPSADYAYDPTYRLIRATGREHLGQTAGVANAPSKHSYNDVSRVARPHPGDGHAMGRYTEHYAYDPVGNFVTMRHVGDDPQHPGWTRTYAYEEASPLENGEAGAPLKTSNRLTRTTVGATVETYSAGGAGYDAHGNMLRLPHLPIMQWDFRDQLRLTSRSPENGADEAGLLHDGERTYCTYDAGGQRVRKVTELPNGQVRHERLYLGAFEVYRRNGFEPVVRQTLHVMDSSERLALIETRTAGEEPDVPAQRIRHQFGNHLGSAALELDEHARIISYEEYTPYGSTAYSAVRADVQLSPKRYRYTGMERDEETGLNYHTARYYAPWLGRWVSCDPAGPADGLALYSYCQCSPMAQVDHSGMQSGGPPAEKKRPHGPQISTRPRPGMDDRLVSAFRGIAGSQQAADIALRELYKLANADRAVAIREVAKVLKTTTRAADKVGTMAWSASGLRNLLRADTQGKLSPVGKLLSRLLEKDRSWAQILKKYGDPFSESLTNEQRVATANRIVAASARSSKAMNALQVFGKVLMGLGIAASAIQLGRGIERTRSGSSGEGTLDIAEGLTSIGLTVGTYTAVKYGLLVVKSGTGIKTSFTSLLAQCSIAYAFEEARRATRGEKTMAAEARAHWKGVQDRAVSQRPNFWGAVKYVGAEFPKSISWLIARGQGNP